MLFPPFALAQALDGGVDMRAGDLMLVGCDHRQGGEAEPKGDNGKGVV